MHCQLHATRLEVSNAASGQHTARELLIWNHLCNPREGAGNGNKGFGDLSEAVRLREHSSLEDVGTLKDNEREWIPAFVSAARKQHSGEEVCRHAATSRLSQSISSCLQSVSPRSCQSAVQTACSASCLCDAQEKQDAARTQDWLDGAWPAWPYRPPAPSHGSAQAGGHCGCEKCSSSIHNERVEKIVLLEVC